MTQDDLDQFVSTEHEHKQEIDRLNCLIKHNRAQFVLKHCPIKVGDIVQANGYSHAGKDMMVDGVTIAMEWRSGITGQYPAWYSWGRLLKKDGTPGKNNANYSVKLEA